MNIDGLSLKELLEIAVKSEIESKDAYESIAKRVNNAVLKERLNFLAREEVTHRKFIEAFFRKKLPDKEIQIPDRIVGIEMPDINFKDETVPIMDILYQAMQAEKQAKNFYSSMAEKFKGDKEVEVALKKLANMETLHYNILKEERDSIDTFEEYTDEFPFIHIGP